MLSIVPVIYRNYFWLLFFGFKGNKNPALFSLFDDRRKAIELRAIEFHN